MKRKQKFTNEQMAVINTSTILKDGEILKVNACAGSGKTTTSVGVADANSDKRVLYLVFNKNMREEAEKKFPKNTDVKTINALAYKYVMSNDNMMLKNKEYNAKEIADILLDHGKLKDDETLYDNAYGIKRTLDNFFNSSEVNPYKFFLNDNYKEAGVYFLELMASGEIEITHSGYLKLFHIMLKEDKDLLKDRYDMIILDEAQDTNPVTWDIISKANLPIVCVGDVNQNIYGFRGTLNVMEKIKPTYDLKLRGNFRSKQEILDVANNLMSKYKNTKEFNMTSMVDYSGNEDITSEAYIARTNSRIIQKIIDIMESDPSLKFNLPRGADTIFEYMNEVIRWSETGKVSKYSYKWLEKFKDLIDLEENYLKKMTEPDIELERTLKIIERIGKKGVKEAYRFAATKSLESKSKDTISLLTAHTSKGLEFDKVTILDDFDPIDELNRAYKKKKPYNGRNITADDFKQELNLAYVVLTRAKKVLVDLSSMLSPRREDPKMDALEDIGDIKAKTSFKKFAKEVKDSVVGKKKKSKNMEMF